MTRTTVMTQLLINAVTGHVQLRDYSEL
jgi:hypothetical protein